MLNLSVIYCGLLCEALRNLASESVIRFNNQWVAERTLCQAMCVVIWVPTREGRGSYNES